MAEHLGRIEHAIARVRQEHGNRVAEEGSLRDPASLLFAVNIDEPLMSSDEQPIVHDQTPPLTRP